MSLLAPVNLNQAVTDRIVMLVNDGFSEDAIFEDIYSQCWSRLQNKPERQALADRIAQISAIDVFATGEIPDSPEELES
jgi:hypothetical protein